MRRPWLAIILASAACNDNGLQVIAAQPTADKDDVWIAVITKEEVRKESPRMSKVKVKTLIGSVVTVAFFLTVIVAFCFMPFRKCGLCHRLRAYDGQRILTLCAVMVAALFLLGWLTEKAFDFAGKSGCISTGAKSLRLPPGRTNTIASEEDDEEPVFSEDAVSEHLRFRYDAAGSVKCDPLLVMGNPVKRRTKTT